MLVVVYRIMNEVNKYKFSEADAEAVVDGDPETPEEDDDLEDDDDDEVDVSSDEEE